jgi:hypothetical protein
VTCQILASRDGQTEIELESEFEFGFRFPMVRVFVACDEIVSDRISFSRQLLRLTMCVIVVDEYITAQVYQSVSTP